MTLSMYLGQLMMIAIYNILFIRVVTILTIMQKLFVTRHNNYKFDERKDI